MKIPNSKDQTLEIVICDYDTQTAMKLNQKLPNAQKVKYAWLKHIDIVLIVQKNFKKWGKLWWIENAFGEASRLGNGWDSFKEPPGID